MELQDPKNQTLSYLLEVLRSAYQRYWRIAIGPALVFFVLILFVSFRFPDYFTARTLIFIQPKRINSKLISDPPAEQMRELMESLVQGILSRPELKKIIERYRLYPQYLDTVGAEESLLKFRKAISVNPVKSPTGQAQLLQTFQLEFIHQDPGQAFQVAKALSNLFIEESVLNRRSEIQGTEEFIDAQLQKARKTLEETENQVQEFVRANFGKLPEHLSSSAAKLESLQSQLATNSQVIASSLARRGYLQSDLGDSKLQSTLGGHTNFSALSNSPGEGLAQLEVTLALLTSKYSEDHPDVIATRQKIQRLRQNRARSQQRRGDKSEGGVTLGDSDSMRNIRRELNELDIQVTSLKSENEHIKETIEKLQKDIEAMPVKEQELLKIKRDYTNVKANYERLLAAKEDATLQSSLVRSEKATQFRVVEPPELPVIPTWPNRWAIRLGGLIGGGIVFFGIVIGCYLTNRAFKSTEELEEAIGIRVIGSIPPMLTAESILSERRLLSTSLLASGLSMVGGCLIIFLTL